MGSNFSRKMATKPVIKTFVSQEYIDRIAAENTIRSIETLKSKRGHIMKVLQSREQQIANKKELLIKLKQEKGIDKAYLKSEMNGLKNLMTSRGNTLAVKTNVEGLLIQIEDANLQSSINEGYIEFMNGMKSFVSDDKLKNIEKLVDKLSENNQNISDFNESIQELNKEALEGTKRENYMELEDEDFMDELDQLLGMDIEEPKTKIKIIENNVQTITTNNNNNFIQIEEQYNDDPIKQSKKEEELYEHQYPVIPIDDDDNTSSYDNTSNQILEEDF